MPKMLFNEDHASINEAKSSEVRRRRSLNPPLEERSLEIQELIDKNEERYKRVPALIFVQEQPVVDYNYDKFRKLLIKERINPSGHSVIHLQNHQNPFTTNGPETYIPIPVSSPIIHKEPTYILKNNHGPNGPNGPNETKTESNSKPLIFFIVGLLISFYCLYKWSRYSKYSK